MINDEFETDVLIIGGGMAAAWAAISAARQGASVVVVDKGFLGTSGVTATGGPNHWWVPPDAEKRSSAIERRFQTSFGLADKDWMATIIDITWRTLPQLSGHYPFAADGTGQTYYSGVRGPEYMRALRALAIASGVRILDHHPALELLLHKDGSAAGAAGYARLDRRNWACRAAAVVLATGGCAFRSGLIGSHNNTGDGHLMAAEAGAELSGMEFNVSYSISPAWNSTRTLPYMAARFFDALGNELDIPPPLAGATHLKALAEAFAVGPVYADLRDAPSPLKTILRHIQPASMVPFERKGVRLFEERFEVKLFGEGTIRGTGGLRVAGDLCQTTVASLFAAGDTATRELVAGATSGGGAQNAAWALSSGILAGMGAASVSRGQGRRSQDKVEAAGLPGIRPSRTLRRLADKDIVHHVQNQILPLDRALWRNARQLTTSQDLLNGIWEEIAAHGGGEGLELIKARETAALTAVARWCTAAALTRQESRGMHMRTDFPTPSRDLESRLLVGGLNDVWTRFEAEVREKAEA